MPQNSNIMSKSQKTMIEEEKDMLSENYKKRPKERNILDVINRVKEWRKLYQGYYREDGIFVQYSLEIAAQLVGISKKTLDDYLYQLKSAKKYGFNFNFHINDKIGVLRSFVRREKEKKKFSGNNDGLLLLIYF